MLAAYSQVGGANATPVESAVTVIPPDPPINLWGQKILRGGAELLVAHHAVEDFIIAFHPLNEQIIENTAAKAEKVRTNSAGRPFLPAGL